MNYGYWVRTPAMPCTSIRCCRSSHNRRRKTSVLLSQLAAQPAAGKVAEMEKRAAAARLAAEPAKLNRVMYRTFHREKCGCRCPGTDSPLKNVRPTMGWLASLWTRGAELAAEIDSAFLTSSSRHQSEKRNTLSVQLSATGLRSLNRTVRTCPVSSVLCSYVNRGARCCR